MKQQKKWIAAALSLLLSCTAMPLSAFAVELESNEEIIYEFLTDTLQLNTATASGILANIYQESGFEPTASCIDTNQKISYGICQWNGPRYEALQAFCSQNGYAYDSLSGQLAYLEYDLLTTYSPYYYNTLLTDFENSAQGAYDAAYSWAAVYEVCSTIYRTGRAELARDTFYPYYETYVTVAPTPYDMGTDFYAAIQCGSEAKTLSINSSKQLLLQKSEQKENWHFIRQEDGSYFILQSEGRYYLNGQTGTLTLDEQASRWFLYETETGFLLQDAESGLILQESLNLQDIAFSLSTAFSIQTLQAPTAVSLTVQAGTFPMSTTLQWTASTETAGYTLSIWSGTDTSQTPLYIENGLQGTSYRTTLSAGTYTAVLQQVNAAGTTKGTPVTFTVTEQQKWEAEDGALLRFEQPESRQFLTPQADGSVQMIEKNDTAEQIWKLQKTESGYYLLDSQTGLALSAAENGTLSLQEQTAERQAYQIWTLYQKDGSVMFYQNGKMLTRSENQTELVLQSAQAKETQLFIPLSYNMKEPALTVSSNGSLMPVLLQWDAVDGAASYQVTVQTEDGEMVVQQKTESTGQQIALEQGNYIAHVQAENAVAQAVSSEVPFTVKNLPLEPAVRVNNGLTDGSIQVQWNDSMYADESDVRICEAETGKCVQSVFGLTGLRYTFTLPDGDYIAKVTARNTAAINCAATGTSASFSIVTMPQQKLTELIQQNKQYLHELE